MTVAIVFREGHSGHFLSSIIQNIGDPEFKMIDTMGQPYATIHLTHDINLNCKMYDLVLRILPEHKVYNAIYNIFAKKLLLEEYKNFNLHDWKYNTQYWYDRCFYQIKHYFEVINEDIRSNTFANVVNFDMLTNETYLAKILEQHFNIELDNSRIEFLNQYKSYQLNIDLLNDSQTNMESILLPITDTMLNENPWFWAYSVFKFEYNNNLSESQRLWSVNDCLRVQTRNDLINNSKLYSI